MNRPSITRDAVLRLLDTRRRIERLMAKARNEVIAAQLVAMRATAP